MNEEVEIFEALVEDSGAFYKDMDAVQSDDPDFV